MVFESIVADILNKFLGNYVVNLDSKQLSIGIWGGDVMLSGLKFRENALDELDLPVNVVYGYLGKLILKIPWKNLYTQRVVAQVEDMYAIITPKLLVKYNAEKEENLELQSKQATLQALDVAYWKDLNKDAEQGNPSFTEKLTAQIVNNLQVKIANVHIRYEDTTTTGSPFSFGITLKELEFYTTDMNWEKTFLTEQVNRVFKLANLDSLAVYMNCQGRLYSALSDVSSALRDNIAHKEKLPKSYTYVFGPISSYAKLALNMRPETDDPPFQIQKVDLNLEMETLNIGLTSTQFQDIIKLAESMNRMKLGVRYRKYRPFNKPYKGNYREWWNFAITAILEEDIRRKNRCWSWEHMLEHRSLCKTYFEKYKEKQLSKKPPAYLTETCTLIEKKLDIFNLILIRKRLLIELTKIRERKRREAAEKSSWFGWFGGGQASENDQNNLADKFEAAMTKEEKEKLYAAIGYDENTIPVDLPEEYVALKMNFKLVALRIGLYDDTQQQMSNDKENVDVFQLQTIMLLDFTMTQCSVEQRPAANALSVTACMKEMKLTGLETPLSDPPILIESKITDEFNLLDIFFETNPIDKKCDQRINVHARPLRIIYDSPTVLHLISVFSPPKSVNLSEIEVAATERMANFKERSATGMQYIIETHCVIEVVVQVMPTIFIVPSDGIYKADSSSLIIVSLGQLSVNSTPRKQLSVNVNTLFESGAAQDEILQNMMDRAYDVYSISLDDIQVLVSKSKENWESILSSTSLSEMHVLNPTSLNLTAKLCVLDDDPRLPKTRADIEIPSIHINLTEDRIYEALRVATSIPLPESDTPEPSTLTKKILSSTSIFSLSLPESKRKKKQPSKIEDLAITEVIQYTDLEVKFSLKEIGVTLYKTSCLKGEKCSTQESSPVESEKFGTPVEEIAVAEIEEIDFERPQDARKILSLQILQLDASMAQRTYEMVATARLGAIKLMQYDRQDETEDMLSIIDTPQYSKDMNFLLTVCYTQANKTSPEFTTKYNSTEQLAVITFSILQITAHQEYILHLMELANNFQNKLTALTSKPPDNKDRVATAADVGILDKLSTIWEDGDGEGATESQPQQPQRKPLSKVVESIKMHVVANLEQVALLVTCRKRPLASLSIKYFNAGVVMKSSYTEVTLRLKDIIIIDPNPLSIHSGILSIVGKDALNTQVVLYNLDETADYNSDDMKIVVDIGCVKIVFLNWFVTSVLSFLNNFQAAQEAVASASAAAADAAKQNAMQAYEKATRMKFDIKMKAPIIVVPEDSQSIDAIVLDLGSLKISNVVSIVEVKDENRGPAMIDDIQLELKDLKCSKCTIAPAATSTLGGDPSKDTVDLLYGLKSDVNILDPISFILDVKRNLTSSWYFEAPEMDISGRLKSIHLNIFMDDYGLLMAILNRNLTEGADEFPTQEKPRKPVVDVVEIQTAAEVRRKWEVKMKQKQKNKPDSPKLSPLRQKKVFEQLKFNFQFDGVIANLFLGINDGLARFGLYFLSMKGTRMVSGAITTSIVLCNVQIEDTRQNSKSAIKTYLCRKEWKVDEAKYDPTNEFVDVCRSEAVYMVDITAIIKPNDTFAEVRVYGFDLIICIDFLMEVANFFKSPEETEEVSISSIKPTDLKATDQKSCAKQVVNAESPTTEAKKIENKLNMILIVDEPDIILVESLEDINTNAIIFNTKAYLNYRCTGEKQIINGQIDSLKMYMCSFMPERRESTKHYIIHPCGISLQGSTPIEEGLHINLKMSEIVINVSPATIELMNKALLSITTSTAIKGVTPIKEPNYRSLWKAASFEENQYWFIRVDEAEDVLNTIETLDCQQTLVKYKTERCIIEIPSIILVVESGVGYYTKPLISIDTKLNATIRDWSYKMNITGSLCLSMNYFNQYHAIWEPVIEFIERTNKNGLKGFVPWELSFGLWIETKKSEFDETVEEQTTKIKIKSEDVLELTVSKTCLELIGDLSEAFSQAIDAKGLAKPDVVAPYVVENDTGFDISINFKRGIFTLHECHMPNSASTPTALNRCLVFKMQNSDNKIDLNQVSDCKISPGGKAYLQTKNISTITLAGDEQYNLHVTVGDIKKEIVLSVHKSDTRYYPLYRDTNQEPWGILSEVRPEFGTTRINIHGALNIHNHFTASVTVYRQKPQTNEKMAVGVIPPGEVYHVPLHAIYADKKELYFSLAGYNVSIQGIKWNDCPTDLSYCRQVQCDPIDTFEPFYMSALRKKTEVFYENTSKYKLLSAFYTIHLRAPLYLRNALPICITVSVAGCSVRQREEINISKVDMSKSAVKEELLDYGEKQIEPGDVLLLPTVKIGNRNKEGRSYLVIRLIQYLEKDWSCTTEVSSEEKDLELWTFTSYDSSVQMNIDLCVRFERNDCSLMVILFSPFWMINKTGLMLSYKTDNETVDVLYHPPEYNGLILFSFTEKFFFDKKRASIRVSNGEWSSKIPLDVAGSVGSVACKVDDITYEIGVHNHLTHNSLTKQITFIPFYTATNKCSFRIDLQEKSRPGDDWLKIEPNECQPLWPLNDSDHMIVARVDGQRTAAFNYSEMQCTLLQLQNKYGGINVDVQTTEGGIYITFTQYNRGDAPGKLINHTSKPVIYLEKGSKTEHVLNPHERILYTWMNPAGEKILVFGKNKAETDLRRDGVGPLVLSDGSKAYWVSFLDGLQRVLLFTEVEAIATKTESSSALQSLTQTIEIGIHGIGLSVVNNETGVDILYLGIISSGIIWEQKKENKKRFKTMNIHDMQAIEAQYEQYLLDRGVNNTDKIYSLDNKWPLNFEAMTLTKASSTRRIQRTFYPGIWISQKSSPFQTQLHVKINKIQIDNQLRDCIFPVVLAPIPPPKSVAATTSLKPFIECSMVERVVPNSTVKQFKYASILMQEFHFKVDILFLNAVSNLFNSSTNEEQAAKLFAEDVLSIEKPLSDLVQTQSLQEQKNFYDNLHLGPLKIHVSFSMAGSDTTALPGFLSTLVQGVGVTLTDVNDVVFRLAFFEREYRFFTHRQLMSEITTHYTGQALKQLYVLVLGLDVLGNPYGLVVGLKKGVEDLFYEPFQGAIQGPGEFAEGLVLGVKSLFGHTVGGAAGAVSKITGAVGKGIAALTFDEDYQRKRRENLNKRPTTFHEGIARSGKGLVMGFVDGVTGVVSKPVAGAREEGVEGFFKGLGKGAIGLVARPTAGVVDFASGSFEAVKRATESHEEAQRLRPPRFLHQDMVLRPYCLNDAQGNKLLMEIDKGKYASTDNFSHCEEVIPKHEYVILTNHRVIYAHKNDLFGTFAVQWAHLWDEIDAIASTDRGIELKLKKEGKKMMGLFSTHEGQRRLIPLQQKSRRDALIANMTSVRKLT